MRNWPKLKVSLTLHAVMSDKLKMLRPIPMDAFERKSCLAGTQQRILESVTEWMITPSPPRNILWLRGLAGSGKSTIANTIAEHFRGIGTLGAFLFFDRTNPLLNNPKHVIRTLSYQLAMSIPELGKAVSAVIEERPGVVEDPLSSQLPQLLIEPMKNAQSLDGAIIIVIDAIDECGDAASRRDMLLSLIRALAGVPPVFRD